MPDNFKVLLINAPYPYQLATTTRDVHEAMERKPPLGILSIGTYLKASGAAQVRLLDMQAESMELQAFAAWVQAYQPDLVGISTVSFKLASSYRVTQIIKATVPGVHVCWGGPHVSIYPHESLGLPGVDSIVLGDGEVPMLKMVQALSTGAGIGQIKGVYTRLNEPVDRIFKEYVHADLNDLPLPDLTLLPYQHYRAFLTNDLMATAVTSRGCPHRCIFCKLDFSKVRLLAVSRVVDQVAAYLALGVREIEFYDETFNINTQRVAAFAEEVLRRKLRFKWSFRGRVDAVDALMLRLAKQAGCQRIQYGVEAGTDRVLKILKKGTSVGQVRECFKLTRCAGIDSVAYFILGNPGETLEEMRETVALARQIRPTYLEFSIFNISPGTEAYRMALDQGVVAGDDWRAFAADPAREMPVLTWIKGYPYAQLEAFRKEALRCFYMRPGYIFDRLMHTRPKEAVRVARMGWAMISNICRGKP